MPSGESVLVVDDDLDFLGIIKRILERKGFEVSTASSGAAALACLEKQFHNVSILDISLPDTDGTELLSTIIAHHPTIVAIMLTGHSSVQNAVKSLNCGAFAYLEKPLDPDSLVTVINRGLEKQHLEMENQRLLEQLERHNHISNTLLSVAQAVSQSLDFQQIIDAALERVEACTGVKASFVYLKEDDRLTLKGQRGLTYPIKNLVPGMVDVDYGFLGKAFSCDGETIISLETYEGADLEFLELGNYQAFAAIPLILLGENIGLLCLATDANINFARCDTELRAGIAREMAIAIRNAQLYEEASSANALRELDIMRTEFLANVSHELRTPLAVIKGSANSLLQPDVIFDEQTRREFLVSIDKDADSLTRLVDDLLMMSRLEADGLEVKKKQHTLNELVYSFKDRFDTLTTRHRLRIDIPADLPLVEADDIRIGEVLTNLIENAVKFSGDNTTIALNARAEDSMIQVRVTDQGIGIPEELHEKVFERFFQGEGRKAGRRKGTGLGLSICRKIVEAHGGAIHVESEPGKGASFIFTLPAA